MGGGIHQGRAGNTPAAAAGHDPGWIQVFRCFPVAARIFLIVALNAIGLILVALFIWKGSRDVDLAGGELRNVRTLERLFTEIDNEAGSLQNLIHRFLSQPTDELLREIERHRTMLFARLNDAPSHDADIADEVLGIGDVSQKFVAGFNSLREVNERLRGLYEDELLPLAAATTRMFLDMDSTRFERHDPNWSNHSNWHEQFSDALVEANTFFFAHRKAALDDADERFARIERELRSGGDQHGGGKEDGNGDHAHGPGEDRIKLADNIARVRVLLGRMAMFYDEQQRYLTTAIDGNQAALTNSIDRVSATIRTRELQAQTRLDGALGNMRQRVLIVGLIFLLASVLVSMAIARSIAQPVGDLRDTMLAIVNGDYKRVISGTTAIDELGAMARTVEVFRENVVARRQAEIDREEQERRWRMILETSPIGVSILSAEGGQRLYDNQKFRALFGVPTGGSAGRERPFHENFAVPSDAIRLSEAVKRFGAVSGWEVRMRRAEANAHWWCLMEVRPIEFHGRPAHVFWHYDVTDRRRAEDELRSAKEAAERALDELGEAQRNLVEAEKLAAIGGLVAGVAHEVNNPVGISLTVASSLSRRTETFAGELDSGQIRKSQLSDFVASVREAGNQLVANLTRAGELVQSFKQVAVDRTHAERRTFDLQEAVEQIVTSLKPSLKVSSWHLEADVEAGITMDSYPGPLGQVITNLFMNALVHAFEDDKEGTFSIIGRRIGGQRVELVFRDNGFGMDEEAQRRAFEPFFTTRRGKGGTGLGLHIVYNLVTLRLGGEISLTSEFGEGATFRVVLPLAAPNEAGFPGEAVRRSGNV